MEFLVSMTIEVPRGTPAAEIDRARVSENADWRELGAQGRLLRLWRPPCGPGQWCTLGLFAARDEPSLRKLLTTVPLQDWRSDEVAVLSAHPNDPLGAGAGSGVVD